MHVVDPGLVRQLSERSARYRDPVTQVDWAALDTASDWLPEEATSLYGIAEYPLLAADVRRRLSQYEFINVMCCGLWLESVFMQRLARELRPAMPPSQYQFVLHQLREEAGHSLMFLEAIARSGLPFPPGAWRAPRAVSALARFAPADGDVFRLAMMIGEHVPDTYNRWLRRQPGLHPVVGRICTVHVVDEARHIAYARSSFAGGRPARSAARARALAGAARLLLGQLARVFYFPPARFYELAGLPDGAAWRRRALRNPVRMRFVEARLRATRRLLDTCGIIAR